MADVPSPKAADDFQHPSYNGGALRPEEAAKAPGGMDFIAEKTRIDSEFKLPVNSVKRATWYDLPRSSTT